MRARIIVRTGAAATILEGLWFAHCRFVCLVCFDRVAIHDVHSEREQSTRFQCDTTSKQQDHILLMSCFVMVLSCSPHGRFVDAVSYDVTIGKDPFLNIRSWCP